MLVAMLLVVCAVETTSTRPQITAYVGHVVATDSVPSSTACSLVRTNSFSNDVLYYTNTRNHLPEDQSRMVDTRV